MSATVRKHWDVSTYVSGQNHIPDMNITDGIYWTAIESLHPRYSPRSESHLVKPYATLDPLMTLDVGKTGSYQNAPANPPTKPI